MWLHAGVAILAGLTAQGQEAPAFEVAAIKPANPHADGSTTHTSTGRFMMDNFSLRDCIKYAFDVKDYALAAPSWSASPRFDIVAKPPAGASPRQYRAMLQTLLVQRFKLEYHREPKVVSAYVLVVDPKGLKVKPVKTDEPSGETWAPALIRAHHDSMAQFADVLSRQLDCPVKDGTGVDGIFDITLTFLPDDASTVRPPAGAGDPDPASSIFSALREQAGLRLEAQRVTIDIIVVDRVERQPTKN